MKYFWDENKRTRNIRKHGVDFADAQRFNWDSALIVYDDKDDYGENRWVASGLIDYTLHVMAYSEPDEETVRVISLRKATPMERKNFGKR